jgi:hypothetical protein
MTQLFANNAFSTLASAITNTATSLTVQAGAGAKFPSPSGGDYFLITLFQLIGGIEANHEVVKVTARSVDTFTIVRGQEGTTARAWGVGDQVSHRATAGSLGALAQLGAAGQSFAQPISVPTASAGDNSTTAASTAFVTAAVAQAKADLIASSPAALDTLNELAAALGNDANFSTTVTTALGNRLRVDINTQGLTTTQKSNAATNLGLAAVATSGNKADVGLGNVNNTSDADKPVSTLTQTALDLKANLSGAAFTGNVSTTGDLTLGTQGKNIIGDFSDATLSNRVSFRTSVANSFTSVAIRPNGTGTAGQVNAFNASDMANSAYLSTGADATAGFLNSKVSGTGTLLPLAFRMNSTEIARFDTSGNFMVGATAPTSSAKATINNTTSNAALALVGKSSSNVAPDVEIQRTSTAVGVGQGAAIQLTDTGTTSNSWLAQAGAGNLQFYSYAGGAWGEKARFDINGNFGLGQTAPSKYTHGGSARVLELLNTDTAANSQAHAIMSSNCTGASSAIGTVSFVMPSISATNKIMAYIGAGSDSTHTSAAPSSSLYFGTRTAGGAVNQNMTLDGSGNLGIGVTPSAKLHVAGKTIHGVLGTSGQYAVTHMPDTSGSTVFSWKNSSDAFTLLTGGDPYSSPIERLRVNSSGRLGLSTSGPNTLLELRTDSNTDGPVITLNNRGTGNTTNTNNYIAGGIWGAAYRDVRDPAYIAGIDFLRNSSTSGLASDGNIVFYTSSGGDTLANVRSVNECARIDSSGNLLVNTTSGSCHTLYKSVAQGTTIAAFGSPTTVQNTQIIYGCSDQNWNAAATAVGIGRNTSTGRSINAAGTINASGADYAEYMTKADGCGVLAKGQIIGVDSHGKLTDKWADAISFLIKSTDPAYVGGDVWGTEAALGTTRPVEPMFVAPEYTGVDAVITEPHEDDTDEIKAQRAQYEDDQAAHNAAVQAARHTFDTVTVPAYQAALADFEVMLEAARQKVDRIAYCGQVPVNVIGAAPGQYVVPTPTESGGISAVLVPAADMTLAWYMRAVGIVQNILADGRANVRVKVV